MGITVEFVVFKDKVIDLTLKSYKAMLRNSNLIRATRDNDSVIST